MTSIDNRKKTEKQIHDDYFSGNSTFRKKQEIYYPKNLKKIEQKYISNFFGNLNNKKILVYGIGCEASLLKSFIDKGAYVVGVDISVESVKSIKSQISGTDYEKKSEIIEMDCEYLTFEPDSFDYIFGRAIIHHLDIAQSIKQIKNVLKKDGKFAFVEPLATNPIIQFYRRLTPQDRTPDEHPLTSADLKLFSNEFAIIHFKFQHALALLSYLIRKLTTNESIFMFIYSVLSKIDAILMNIPGYRLLCWDVIIHGQKKV